MGTLQLAPHPEGQALVGELIEDIEHPELAAIWVRSSTKS
jgi:hypothetical protein